MTVCASLDPILEVLYILGLSLSPEQSRSREQSLSREQSRSREQSLSHEQLLSREQSPSRSSPKPTSLSLSSH